ncbi:tRNA (Thr-GGU) A37 N-methylase [Bradyrhizobium japonicum]
MLAVNFRPFGSDADDIGVVRVMIECRPPRSEGLKGLASYGGIWVMTV